MSMPNSDRAEMNDLINHLSAALDEDQWIAQGAARDDGADWEAGKTFQQHGSDSTDDHIARHDPARVLREVEALRQVINDYRMSDRACMRSDDPGSPEYATLRAGRDAFATVLRALATATGWKGDG